jgi:hypothetical protein
VNGNGEVTDSAIPEHIREQITKMSHDLRIDPSKIVGAIDSRGYTQLNEGEKTLISKIMATSPTLAFTVGKLVEYTLDERALMQTDLSVLPPSQAGYSLYDDVEDEPEAQILNEHLTALTAGTITEDIGY